jgi:hypothetical protein
MKETNSHTAGSPQTIRLFLGDSFKRIEELANGELVAVVCDPPYG